VFCFSPSKEYRVGVPGVFDIVRGLGGTYPTSFGLKSTVRALSAGKKTVMRTSPSLADPIGAFYLFLLEV
jgi:hypothetical protein